MQTIQNAIEKIIILHKKVDNLEMDFRNLPSKRSKNRDYGREYEISQEAYKLLFEVEEYLRSYRKVILESNKPIMIAEADNLIAAIHKLI